MEDTELAEYRHAVRGHLADRPSVAQSAPTIHRALKRQFDASEKDTLKACQVLVALDQFKEVKDALCGSVKYFQITGKGIIDHESGR